MSDSLPNNSELYLNDTAKFYLRDTAKWAKFLAIIGFVGCGLMVLLGIFFSTIMGAMSQFSNTTTMPFAGFGLIYVALAAVYFFPSWYLFQFARDAKLAIDTDNSDLLANAIDKHHSMYKFMGIFAAIILGLYVLVFLFMLVGVAFLGANS